jgi:hypothetical protein
LLLLGERDPAGSNRSRQRGHRHHRQWVEAGKPRGRQRRAANKRKRRRTAMWTRVAGPPSLAALAAALPAAAANKQQQKEALCMPAIGTVVAGRGAKPGGQPSVCKTMSGRPASAAADTRQVRGGGGGGCRAAAACRTAVLLAFRPCACAGRCGAVRGQRQAVRGAAGLQRRRRGTYGSWRARGWGSGCGSAPVGWGSGSCPPCSSRGRRRQ